jgi:hypothetical protein
MRAAEVIDTPDIRMASDRLRVLVELELPPGGLVAA